MIKNIIIYILITSFPVFSFAQTNKEACSSAGYTIGVINGIKSTTLDVDNYITELSRLLPDKYKRETVFIKKLYNQTSGFSADFSDALKQKLLEASGNVQDADFVSIFNDAKNGIKTQKLLLVAHSQGNFYANTLYDTVVGRDGGLSLQSVGMYSVATPANRVSGGGEYITSSNDKVISDIVAKASTGYTLPSNDTLEKTSTDNFGHGFLEVYLKQRPGIIMGGIERALERLSSDSKRNENTPCIAVDLPKTTTVVIGQVIAGGLGVGADQVISKVTPVILAIGNTLTNTAVALGSFARDAVAQLLSNDSILADNNAAAIILATNPVTQAEPALVVAPLSSNSADNNPTSSNTVTQKTVSVPVFAEAPSQETTDSVQIELSSMSKLASVGTQNVPMVFGGGAAPEVSAATTEVGSPTEESVGGGSFPPASSTPADVVPPVITIIGEAHATSTEGFEYIDKGATAFDERDGEIVVTASSTVDITTPGVYVVLYTAVDKSNNIATSTRVVDIIPAPSIDRTPPVVTILGPNPEMVVVGSTYIDAGASAIDDVDGARDVIATSTVDTNTIGGYTVTYLTQDSSGNVATSTRVVNVLLKSGQQINFKENNRISYAGSFAICDVDHKVANVYGSVGLYGNFVSSSGWGTRYQVGVNTGMTPGVHYRFIFGSLSTIMQECQRGMYSSNVSNIFHYTNSSGDSVVYDPRSASFMTSFYFPEITNDTQQVIDPETHLITVVVPRGTNVAALAPTIKVSAGAQVEPNTGVVQDFTSPVSYKVTATDGSYHFYTVKVVLEGQKLNFDAANKIYYAGYFGLCDVDNRTMNITGQVGMWNQFVSSSGWGTPYQAGVNTDMLVNKNYRFIFASSDKAYFDCTNNMFTSNYSENFYYTTPSGSSVVYSTYVKPPPSSAKSITSFDVNVATSTVVGVIDEVAHRVDLIVPFETNVTVLSPVVTTSPLATTTPASSVAQDFTMPVEYIVTAEDGTTQTYIVTVTAESISIPPVVASSERAIVALDILVASSTISGVVDEMAHTISLTVPFGTDVLALSPRIVVSALATSSPASLEAQDFTNPVMYTVTAEDSSTQVYVVSVVVEAPPAALFPIISSYTFNGIAGNITADFATTTPTIELSLVANKDVDWVSVTIEYQADATKYKRYYSGAGCVDGTAVCIKTWDGVLSGGEVAPNGEYRIKAHIKDTDDNDFNDYLLPYIITINRAVTSII